jgi:probable blue pigment (indigoidine) exporter
MSSPLGVPVARVPTAQVPSEPAPSDRIRGLALLLVAACSWGCNWPVAKFLLSELPPFTMRAVCCVGATAFAFLLAVTRGEALAPPRAQWRRLLMFATLNYGAFVVLTTFALVWLPASEAVIITYTLPIWAALLAWPVLGERPTVLSGAAVVLGLGGVALLVGIGEVQADPHRVPGVVCGLGAAMSFGLGTVIAKRRPLALPPITGAAWQILLSSFPLLMLAGFEHPDWGKVTAAGWIGCLFSATLPYTIAYLAWFGALRRLPASTATIGVLLAPVLGVFASAVLLGDPLGARQVVALAMTVGGIALAARG